MPAATTPASTPRQEILLALALLGFTAVVFWPPLHWLASQTFAREQLKQSFILVVLAGVWIAWEKRQTLRVRCQFSNVALGWLVSAYALAAAALVLKGYPLTPARHDEIRKALEERDAAATASA